MRVTFRCKRCARDIEANFTRAGKMVQCTGCHYTQEIPDPSGGGGGEDEAPAPPSHASGGGQGAPAAPPRKKGGGGGGGVDAIIKKLVIFAILAIAAFVAYKFGKGRFF
ncbi:MAG: hypothetical protein AAB074_10185 [Planctomycetota bacterium]